MFSLKVRQRDFSGRAASGTIGHVAGEQAMKKKETQAKAARSAKNEMAVVSNVLSRIRIRQASLGPSTSSIAEFEIGRAHV